MRARGVHQDVTRRVRVLPVAPYILGRSVSLPPLPSGLALRVFETGRVVPKARTSSCLFPPFLSSTIPFLFFFLSSFFHFPSSLVLSLCPFVVLLMLENRGTSPRPRESRQLNRVLRMRFFLRASRFMCECWLEYYLISVRRHIYMEFTEIDILLDTCFSFYNKEVVAPT